MNTTITFDPTDPADVARTERALAAVRAAFEPEPVLALPTEPLPLTCRRIIDGYRAHLDLERELVEILREDPAFAGLNDVQLNFNVYATLRYHGIEPNRAPRKKPIKPATLRRGLNAHANRKHGGRLPELVAA
jgi:hypothetical protein